MAYDWANIGAHHARQHLETINWLYTVRDLLSEKKTASDYFTNSNNVGVHGNAYLMLGIIQHSKTMSADYGRL